MVYTPVKITGITPLNVCVVNLRRGGLQLQSRLFQL